MAFFKLPYGYFTLLRWAVCVVAIYHVVLAYNMKRGVMVVYFGLIAILFNPIIPVYLSRQAWWPVDLVTASLFLLSFAFLKRGRSEK
jgi:hypothetical protein